MTIIPSRLRLDVCCNDPDNGLFGGRAEFAMLGLIWLSAALIAFAMIAVAWDYFAPTRWQWLTDSQLSGIKTFLFGGAVTGLGGRYLGSRIRGIYCRSVVSRREARYNRRQSPN